MDISPPANYRRGFFVFSIDYCLSPLALLKNIFQIPPIANNRYRRTGIPDT